MNTISLTTPRANDTTPWWTDHNELAALISWLDATGRANDIRDAVAVLGKPWNWSNEHAAMLADRAGAVFFPCYARQDVDPEENDANGVPPDGVGPVTYQQIAEVCEKYDISAQAFNAAGDHVGNVDKYGDWKREAA